MEIQTKHRLKLLNSKCEYVCIVDNLSKKLDYGDDIECCLNKLFLASKLINRLECYNFPIETTTQIINSEFFTILGEAQTAQLSLTTNLTIQLNVDGTIYTLISSKEGNTGFELIINKLTALGILVSYSIPTISGGDFLLVLICSILNVSFTLQVNDSTPSQFLFTNTVLGVCQIQTITTFNNCIEQSNLREMYAVLDNLLS